MRTSRKAFAPWVIVLCFLAIFAFSPLAVAETDVSEKVELVKSSLRYDRRTATSSMDVAVSNVSPDILLTPLKVVIESISNSSVTVANADGYLDGKPYFEYVNDLGELLAGEITSGTKWIFNNPARARFSFTSVVYGSTAPRVITITGKAVAGLPVVGTINLRDSSEPAKTTFSAIESDGSYQLAIDDTWTPPFLMWAEGWVNNRRLRLLSSFDLEDGATAVNVNTTPITTAIVESAMGKSASDIDPLSEPIPDQSVVDQIREHVQNSLANLFEAIGIPEGFNLFEDPIGEIGSPTDQLFDTVGVSSDDEGNIVFTDLKGEQFVIAPDGSSGDVPQEIVDNVLQTGDALEQIGEILSSFDALFDDPNSPPDLSTLESELLPNLANGFLQSGEGIGAWISRLASGGAPGNYVDKYLGCAIYRPMKSQFYGTVAVEEMPDSHEEGLWILVTTNTNGKVMTWLTSFVNIGSNTWKWYGNRRPFISGERGRPRASQIKYPSGSMVYQSGLHLWHNDVGNLALNMGIRSLAVFNPAFAPETIGGVATNCVRLERRAGGIDTRFRLKDVTTWWMDDALYQLSKESGDRLIDLDVLKSQEPIEMVVFGLDDAGDPVRSWLYVIPEPPQPVSELEANPEQFFATIDRDSISYQAYDNSDPDNPDAFPGEGGFFSWTFPTNEALFPSWAMLGWNDINWHWNEYQIINPLWYEPGDFDSWSADFFTPGPNAISPRDASLFVVFRDTNDRHYEARQIWDPWSEHFISVENDHLVFDVERTWSPNMLNPGWGSMTARTRIRGKYVTRLEVPVVVESADTSGNAYVETDLRLTYQPPEDYSNRNTNFIGVFARLRYQSGTLSLQGFVWGSRNADASDSFNVPPMAGGNFPFGQELNFNQSYTLAVEYIESSNQLVVEFNDGIGPRRSYFDMSSINNFNFDPANFESAEIATRVRSLQQDGDTGRMRVSIDETWVNGDLFDTFTGGFANNKWDIISYE